MASYPALTVTGIDPDFALAIVDDFSPSAADSQSGALTLFFSDRQRRDAAGDALARAYPSAVITSREVDDEDWARRSQANLEPVTIGRIVIVPDPKFLRSTNPRPPASSLQPLASSLLSIVIRPSTGFGTGHHATTRMCLTALQTIDLADRSVLDVGAGSGILAIAAARLGARMAHGIDNDPDAIHAARANLALNPDVKSVSFEVADLSSYVGRTSQVRRSAGPKRPGLRTTFDVVTANLTGALLTRTADTLVTLAAPGGLIIVSGLLDTERDAVAAAFRRAEPVWEAHEDEWVGMMLDTRVAPELKLGPATGRM